MSAEMARDIAMATQAESWYKAPPPDRVVVFQKVKILKIIASSLTHCFREENYVKRCEHWFLVCHGSRASIVKCFMVRKAYGVVGASGITLTKYTSLLYFAVWIDFLFPVCMATIQHVSAVVCMQTVCSTMLVQLRNCIITFPPTDAFTASRSQPLLTHSLSAADSTFRYANRRSN